MSRTTTPRPSPGRRLPARVYWFRRTLVLVVALVLVFAIARVLSSFGGDDSSGTATTVAQTGDTVPEHLSGVTLSPRAGAASVSAPLSQPTGACSDADVKVVPDGTILDGGGSQPLKLEVSSTSGETCTWSVSARSLAVKITQSNRHGDYRLVWTSQDCAGVIPRQTVVVRPPQEQQTKVKIPWGGHTSASDCAGDQPFVGLGTYRIEAASLGGEPARSTLLIVAPPRPRVTETASASPSAAPSAAPSGATPTATPTATRTPGSGHT